MIFIRKKLPKTLAGALFAVSSVLLLSTLYSTWKTVRWLTLLPSADAINRGTDIESIIPAKKTGIGQEYESKGLQEKPGGLVRAALDLPTTTCKSSLRQRQTTGLFHNNTRAWKAHMVSRLQHYYRDSLGLEFLKGNHFTWKREYIFMRIAMCLKYDESMQEALYLKVVSSPPVSAACSALYGHDCKNASLHEAVALSAWVDDPSTFAKKNADLLRRLNKKAELLARRCSADYIPATAIQASFPGESYDLPRVKFQYSDKNEREL